MQLSPQSSGPVTFTVKVTISSLVPGAVWYSTLATPSPAVIAVFEDKDPEPDTLVKFTSIFGRLTP